jgi:hypothetical protein
MGGNLPIYPRKAQAPLDGRILGEGTGFMDVKFESCMG